MSDVNSNQKFSQKTDDPQQLYVERLNSGLLLRLNDESLQKGRDLSLRAEKIPGGSGVRILNSQARVKEGCKAHLLILHGLGASYSNIESVINYLMIFNERGEGLQKKGKPQSTRSFIRENFAFELSAEAVSLPGTVGGIDLELVHSPADFSLWLCNYLHDFKRECPNVPLYVLGRSASVIPALKAIRDLPPKIVQGFVSLAPIYPFDPRHPDWLQINRRDLLNFAAESKIEVDNKMIDWIYHIHGHFSYTPELLSSLPIMTIVGEKDVEQVPYHERNMYRQISKDFDLFEYIEIEGGPHDLLAPNRKIHQQRKDTVKAIYYFINKSN